MTPSTPERKCCEKCEIHLPYKEKNEYQCSDGFCSCHKKNTVVIQGINAEITTATSKETPHTFTGESTPTHNISWESEFDEKFGGFYLYSKSGQYFHTSSKFGQKLTEIDLEINGKKPTASADIKSFISSLLSHQKSEIYREVEKMKLEEPTSDLWQTHNVALDRVLSLLDKQQ